LLVNCVLPKCSITSYFFIFICLILSIFPQYPVVSFSFFTVPFHRRLLKLTDIIFYFVHLYSTLFFYFLFSFVFFVKSSCFFYFCKYTRIFLFNIYFKTLRFHIPFRFFFFFFDVLCGFLPVFFRHTYLYLIYVFPYNLYRFRFFFFVIFLFSFVLFFHNTVLCHFNFHHPFSSYVAKINLYYSLFLSFIQHTFFSIFCSPLFCKI
jgi:hypothetical protein